MSAQTSLLGARTLLIAASPEFGWVARPDAVLHGRYFDNGDGQIPRGSLRGARWIAVLRYPDLRQLTTNIKLNFSPLRHLEFDMDAPYIRIARASGFESASGLGDADLGAKWILRETPPDSDLAAFAGEPVRRITDR